MRREREKCTNASSIFRRREVDAYTEGETTAINIIQLEKIIKLSYSIELLCVALALSPSLFTFSAFVLCLNIELNY